MPKNSNETWQYRNYDLALPEQYRNRPVAIRVAIQQITSLAISQGLTKSTLRVMQAILATGVSLSKPGQPIFAKKITLAKMARCCQATVYRALAQLENADWIRRESQNRLQDGSLDIGLIFISNKILIIIGLDNPEDNSNKIFATNKNNKNISDNKKFVIQEKIGNEHFSDKFIDGKFELEMRDGMRDGSIYKDRDPERKTSVHNQSTPVSGFIQIDGRAVARELFWLIEEKKLDYGKLFKLQTLARKVPGQKLSDFVAYREKRIKQLDSPNDCYRYLKKLIDEGIDARYLCQQQKRRQHHMARTIQRNALLDQRSEWIRDYHDRVFMNPGTQATYKINAHHHVLEVGLAGRPINQCLKIGNGFIKAVKSGILKPWREEIDHENANHHLAQIVARFPGLRLKNRASFGAAKEAVAVG